MSGGQPRRARARAWVSAAALGAVGLTACAAGFWSQGLSSEAPTSTPATANGMVVVLGEAGWRVAAQAIAKDLSQSHPGGLVFDAGASVATDPTALTVGFEGAALHTGPVAVEVDPLGVMLEIATSLEPTEITLEIGGQPFCEVAVAFQQGLLRGRLSLTRSKLGRVHAGVLSDVTLDAADAIVDLTDCAELTAAAAGAQFKAGGDTYLSEAVLDALGAQAFAALGPALADAVPDALGLDLAADATARFGDGVGEGWLRTRVRASEAEQANWWQLAGGRLHVPYAVAMEAKGHACAAGPAQTPPAAQSIPPVVADAALLLADNLIGHAVWGWWRAGGLCGERIAGDLTWRADALLPGWPALAALPADSNITLRVWPDAAPEVLIEDGASGEAPSVRVAIAPWTLEIFADIDGASVRLATLRAGLDIRAGLQVRPDRSVWLAPESVTVTATGGSAGLLDAPEAAVVERIAGPLANALVAARPVWWLPAFPLGPHDAVSHEAGYLVFASRPSGGSD
ncbi:MAG: hypothetical protein R3F39_02690 [Myxococcota bacterium]